MLRVENVLIIFMRPSHRASAPPLKLPSRSSHSLSKHCTLRDTATVLRRQHLRPHATAIASHVMERGSR